jgi:translocation and assembly module TamB
LALSGRLRSPDIRGEARWVDGGVAIPRWGFLAEGIEVRATSPDGQRVQLQGSGRVGNGSLDVDGTVDLDPALGWPTQLTVRGDGLQAVRLPDAQITMSTDFEVLAALPTIEVTGSVTIPRARLELEEIPAQAASPSSDTVVHGSDRPEPEHPLNMHAVIEVELGNDVRYSGAGLDVALSGDMDVVYDSGRNAVATGTVTLMGEYSAYGQTLQLNEGQLLFSGPINNPALDVRATREIEATTVGVQLGGTLIVPTTRIFSEPAMSEADALSYLLLGRPLSGTGDQETATLESAAVSMGLRQALPVIQRVGQSLGLDEFSVQSTAADTGELMAGKQISPRLYMRYSYGLFNRIGGLLLRFSLNDRLSLETRSGDYRSMDLVYTVEQGRRR